jgi:fatty-acid desaturase
MVVERFLEMAPSTATTTATRVIFPGQMYVVAIAHHLHSWRHVAAGALALYAVLAVLAALHVGRRVAVTLGRCAEATVYMTVGGAILSVFVYPLFTEFNLALLPWWSRAFILGEHRLFPRVPFGPCLSLVATPPVKFIWALCRGRGVGVAWVTAAADYRSLAWDVASLGEWAIETVALPVPGTGTGTDTDTDVGTAADTTGGRRFRTFCEGCCLANNWLLGYGFFSITVKWATLNGGYFCVESARAIASSSVGLHMWWLQMVMLWQTYAVLANLCAHRYFGHRCLDTSRLFQIVLALGGASSSQRGVLWWASTHRHHHQHCDTELDMHSPKLSGFLYAHVGWLLERPSFHVHREKLEDYERFWELYVVEAVFWLIPVMLYFGMTGPGGMASSACHVALSASFHSEWCINSVCHLPWLGSAADAAASPHVQGAGCTSRDVWWVGVINGGDGFHSAHHEQPGCAHHGRRHSYNFDSAYLAMCALEHVGLVWNVQHAGMGDTRRKLGNTRGRDGVMHVPPLPVCRPPRLPLPLPLPLPAPGASGAPGVSNPSPSKRGDTTSGKDKVE